MLLLISAWLATHPPRPRAPISRDPESRHCLLGEWFNNTQSGWNKDLVRELVRDEDLALVLSTKLCPKAVNDLLGWQYTKDGNLYGQVCILGSSKKDGPQRIIKASRTKG